MIELLKVRDSLGAACAALLSTNLQFSKCD